MRANNKETFDSSVNLNRLPVSQRLKEAEKKYAEAVGLYASSGLPLVRVAEKFGMSPSALSEYIRKHHRKILLQRYGIVPDDSGLAAIKIRPPKGQSRQTHAKYKDAIAACGDMSYIEYNISQIAQIFQLNPTALASQLRVHYPDILPARERARQRLGLGDNKKRGPRKSSVDTYAKAVEMYRDSDLSIPEVADRCNVSMSGFSQFMRFYHQDVIAAKALRRKEAPAGRRVAGFLSGNGQLYGPKAETVEQYEKALGLYRDTDLSMKEIAARTGIPAAGFRFYLSQWHSADRLIHRGYVLTGDGEPDLARTKCFRKSARSKYAGAIESLRENPRDVARVAAEFGLHPEVFREYLKTHEPDLARERGMTTLPGGKTVKRSAYEKYRKAIEEISSTSESLKDIASRHGLIYNSLYSFVARNCPGEITRRRDSVERNFTDSLQK